MDDLRFSLELLDTLLKEVRRPDMSLAERAGLYAAIKWQCVEFRTYIDERANKDGYAHEKVGQFEWHTGAALGFSVTNGHSASMHITWAMGALSSLTNVLTENNAS